MILLLNHEDWIEWSAPIHQGQSSLLASPCHYPCYACETVGNWGMQESKADYLYLDEIPAIARKDAALGLATKALEQAASHAKERLDWCDDWQEEERWDREDTLTAAALEFCRKALKEEDTK